MNWKRLMSILFTAVAMLSLSACGETAGTVAANGTNGNSPLGGNYMIFVYFAVIIVVFYFMLIRPENKRKKKAQELRNNISVGDEITTIGGLTGTVVSVDGDFITFETGEDRVRIEVAKWAISTKGRANSQ